MNRKSVLNIVAWLFALALPLWIAPMSASAAVLGAQDVVDTINSYGSGSTLNAALGADGTTVTVTGEMTGATSTLELGTQNVGDRIDPNVTIVWQATLTGAVQDSQLLSVRSEDGATTPLRIESPAKIENSASPGAAVFYDGSNSATVVMSGGELKSEELAFLSNNGNFEMSGGSMSSSASTDTANAYTILVNNGKVSVDGGSVKASGKGAIAIQSSGGVDVSDGTIESTYEATNASDASNGQNGAAITSDGDINIGGDSTAIIGDVGVRTGSATVTITGGSITSNGQYVVTTAAGNIVMSGGYVSSSAYGGLESSYGCTLFSGGGVEISGGTVIAIGEGSKAIGAQGEVKVSGGASVESSGERGTAIEAGDDVTISGGATVEASGGGDSTAINAYDGGGVIVDNATVTSSGSAISCEGDVTVNDSTVTSNGDYGSAVVSSNNVTITDSTITASGESSTAIFAGDSVTLGEGAQVKASGNDSQAIRPPTGGVEITGSASVSGNLGNEYNLISVVITKDGTLKVPENETLSVAKNSTIENKGTIINEGKIEVGEGATFTNTEGTIYTAEGGIEGITVTGDVKDISEVPTTPPSGDPGTTPGGDPGGDPGTTPGGDPGTTPGGDPVTPPGGDPVTPPGGDPVTPPGEEPGTTPGDQEDTPPPQGASDSPKASKAKTREDKPAPVVPILYGFTKTGDTFTFEVIVANASGSTAGTTVSAKLNDRYPTTITIGADGVGHGAIEAPGFNGGDANFSARVNGVGVTVTMPMRVYSNGILSRR